MAASRSSVDGDRACAAAAVAETHVSTIFFTTTRAYKLLRPVSFHFLDTSATADRVRLAERELHLNRRFSPDVYLGTADVVEHGELADRIIVMRRLPADRRLSALVGSPGFADHVRAVARRIAAVHAECRIVHDAPMARLERLTRNWDDNFAVIGAHVGTVVDADEFARVDRLAHRFLHGRGALLDRRIADGMVRDGHGDLIAEDIFCLDDGPRILDCLAFDDDLRIGDVLLDVAFLAMDLHRLAGPEIADDFLRWYQDFGDEHHPSALAHHYIAYRAHVRAKIACLRAGQGDRESAELARSYHRLVAHHLARGRLRLVLVGGAPGAGKTSLAGRLAVHFGLVHLQTDEIRHDLTATPRNEHRFADPGGGIYDDATVRATYDEMAREADLLLGRGHGVVLDASWTNARRRDEARCVAERHGAEIAELECVLDPDVANERVRRRVVDGASTLSDATPLVADVLRSRREEWPEAIDVSTIAAADEVAARTIARVEQLP